MGYWSNGQNWSIEHLQGNARVVELALDASASVLISDLSGSSATDVYAVGSKGMILHSNGDGVWTRETNADTNDLSAVWAGSCGAYAVGANGTILWRSP
jgi:hypothetical protein